MFVCGHNLRRFPFPSFKGTVKQFSYAVVALFICCPAFAQQDASKPVETETSGESELKIVSQQFSDWTYQCLVQAEALQTEQETQKPRCEISQSVRSEFQGGSVEIINLSVSKANDKAGKVKWALVVYVPIGLNIHLPSDFGLIVGKKKPFLTRFRNCDVQGCNVVVPADNSLLKQFRRAHDGAARFRRLDGQVVEVKFSLAGFTKALNALGSGDLPLSQGKEDTQ